MDKTLLDPPETIDKSAPSPMPPPSTPENGQSSSEKAPSTPKSDQGNEISNVYLTLRILVCK